MFRKDTNLKLNYKKQKKIGKNKIVVRFFRA